MTNTMRDYSGCEQFVSSSVFEIMQDCYGKGVVFYWIMCVVCNSPRCAVADI